MFSYCDTDYNLDRHLISFLQDSPFFAELSRYIRKVPTKDIPTAGVAFDPQYDDITLYWNPEFFASLTDAEVRGVLVHEFYHLVFQHLSTRRKTPPKMWNVGTDLAINSIIVSGDGKNYALPEGGLIPGKFPAPKGEQKLTKEQKAALPLASLIESFPHGQASEWYFDRLKEKAEEIHQQMKDNCPVHSPKGKSSDSPQNNPNKSDGGNQSDKSKNDSKGDKGDKGDKGPGSPQPGGGDQSSDGEGQPGDADGGGPSDGDCSGPSQPGKGGKGKGDAQGSDGEGQPGDKAEGQDQSQGNHQHGNGGHQHNHSSEQCTCGEDWLDSMDDHSGWERIPEEMQEKVKGQISNIVDKAVKQADAQANGWGSIPANLREEIRKSVSRSVDWRNVLRNFVGSLERGNKTSSMKRINKRYPYIHPGQKRGYTAKLLIAVDQSGSVPNEMLSLFFGELAALTKRVSVTILPFDYTVAEKDMVEWKKGTNPDIKRVRGGGTDFEAPTKFANEPRNRGKWDGMLILTDGECSKPGPSRIKRGWVLGQGCKLHFPTDEITISLDPNPHKTGAWR